MLARMWRKWSEITDGSSIDGGEHRAGFYRRLQLELLEDRRMLANVTVANLLDVVNGDTSSIAGLIANDGGDGISLREAILAANAHSDEDTIDFSVTGTIQLSSLGELSIVQSLSLVGPGAGLLTIKAYDPSESEGDGSRVMHIDDGLFLNTNSVSLRGVTVTGGDAIETGGGVLCHESLEIVDCVISGNQTSGDSARGGGIYASHLLEIENSTISGNRTVGDFAYGGGIASRYNVVLRDVTVSTNRTEGASADGGGVYVAGSAITTGFLSLERSLVSGNSTLGDFASGGGIASYHNTVLLTESTVSGNSAMGDGGFGGGIIVRGANAFLTESEISGNSTLAGPGGGVFASSFYYYGIPAPYGGSVFITDSVISGNEASGEFGAGGGVIADFASVLRSTIEANVSHGASGGGLSVNFANVVQSTISGNASHGPGGGIQAIGLTLTDSTLSGNTTSGANAHGGGAYLTGPATVTVTRSTVANNQATHTSARGGGIFQRDTSFNFTFTIDGSIVADNTAGNTNPDVVSDPQSMLTVNYSLIGDADGLTLAGNVGNLVGTTAVPLDPGLEPLADNGGPTKTHALTGGSPAIDAGDLTIEFAEDESDQRGSPFVRVYDGDMVPGARIDIGAVEIQPAPTTPVLPGDYNLDNIVDAADYTKWRNTLGTSGLDPYEGADGSGDGTVGPEDYQVWKTHYGQSLPVMGGGGLTEVSAPETVAHAVVFEEDVAVEGRSESTSVVEANRAPIEIAAESGGVTLARETRRPVGSRLLEEGNWNLAARDDALAVWVIASEQRATDRRLAEVRWETLEAHEQEGECEAAAELDAVFELVGNGEGGV